MTWYDALGLDLGFQVDSRVCPELSPQPGETVSVRMTNWVLQPDLAVRPDLHHSSTMVLDGALQGASGPATVSFGTIANNWKVTYSSSEPAIARADDGGDFPVAFDLCIQVGDQGIEAYLVCQPKNTGMLCHL